MDIKKSESGVKIALTPSEVCLAINSWVYSQGIFVNGPRIISLDDDMSAVIHVDPSGRVIKGGELVS